jgi:hypothetical protein
MSDRAIQEAIQIISGTRQADKVYLVDCVVLSVDEASRTCFVQAVGGRANNKFTARLMASVDDGMLIIPAINSSVIIAMSDFSRAHVAQYSEVDRMILRGGDLGGLARVIGLVGKFNAIENKLNDLITKFNTHTHNVTATGAPTGPNLLPEVGGVTPTVRGDIENVSITHG